MDKISDQQMSELYEESLLELPQRDDPANGAIVIGKKPDHTIQIILIILIILVVTSAIVICFRQIYLKNNSQDD